MNLKGVYWRAYQNKYDFDSIESARNSNCHDIYKDKDKYRIAKYKIIYELIDDDCDPIIEKDLIEINEKKEKDKKWNERMNAFSIKLYNKQRCDLTLEEAINVAREVFVSMINEEIESI